MGGRIKDWDKYVERKTAELKKAEAKVKQQWEDEDTVVEGEAFLDYVVDHQINEPLFARIERLRRMRGIRANHLCDLVGISPATLSGYLHGKHDLTARNVEKLIKAMGVDIDLIIYQHKALTPFDIRRLLEKQYTEDWWEYKFLMDYEKAKSPAEKQRIITQYTHVKAE